MDEGIRAVSCTVTGEAGPVDVRVLSPKQAEFTMPRGDVSVSVEFAPKLENPLKASGKNVRMKAKKLKAGKQSVAVKKAVSVRDARGKLTYSKVSVDNKKYAKKFTINRKTGKITVQKGVKKGLYKMTVKVRAAGTSAYLPKTVQTVVKVRVR